MTIGEDSTLKDDESKSYGSKINEDECDSTVTVMDQEHTSMDDKGSSFTDDEQKQLEWLIGEDSTLKDDESKSDGSMMKVKWINYT